MPLHLRSGHPYAHAATFPPEGPVSVHELLEQRDGPLEIEIGPGRGAFAIERCQARPEIRLLGLEIRLKWAHLVDERLKKLGFGGRARVLAADAREALGRLGPDASVAAFYLHFPDPWWKKRHDKRLVLVEPLLDSIARLLVSGGELFVQTDVEDRAAQYQARLDAFPALEPAGDRFDDARLASNPYQARSNRERRADADGLPVYRYRYRRRAR
jgi:tRNA (guanine-N7-)-methyltransferase